ncbi:MAG TPA: HAMP domain-containing sensor histidine kinase [Longimicrobium sp.]|nr:HAMP domain-containing sensor histidine kinase [Longimicrobium sp.]
MTEGAPATLPEPATSALETRAQRLESLCRLATDTAGRRDAGEIWETVGGCLPELLDPDLAALATPLLGQVALWTADAAAPDEAVVEEVERLVLGDGLEVRRVELPDGGAGVLAPLLRDGESRGTLLVGWRDGARVDAEAERTTELLGRQMAAALANAWEYARMEEAAFRRERFFSAMSHDLRTPITAIVGYSELLQDGIVGELNERQHEMMERICQVSGHLSQLVNDILDLAKLDAGRMEFHAERVSLGDLLDEALVTVEPQAAAKGLTLRTDVEPHRERGLVVDAPRVRQILVNLLSNAVKFTDRGEVAVVARPDDGHMRIEVRDTGPGIPPGSEEAVFEEFLQIAAGTKSKREPGSGLGLAIARRLARAMGGDLLARNIRGRGAAFTLVLPSPNESDA